MNNKWATNTIEIAGNDIFYTRTGGKKPPIVLAHGFTDDGSCWGNLAKDLQADYDLIMVDAIGHGKSSRISKDKPIEMIEDMHKLITALKLEKPAIIGHSMGAATAAGFAAQYPDEVSVIALEDVPWFDKSPLSIKSLKEGKPSYQDTLVQLQKGTIKEAIAFGKKKRKHWSKTIIEAWARSKMKFDLSFFETKPPESPKWQDIAARIQCPTLLLTGDNDLGALVTPKLAVEALKIMPKVQWAHIPGAGHCIRYDKYPIYLTVVKAFLNREYKPVHK